MKNLTPEQKQDGEDMKANYGANPKMATDDANAIMHDYFENRKTAQELVNTKYAEIYALMRFDTTLKIIQPLVDDIKGGEK